MSPFLQNKKLAFLIDHLLSSFDSAALLNQDNQILGIEAKTIADLGTFSPLVANTKKYFPMNDGDIILTNDPYSGGAALSTINFVVGIKTKDQSFFLSSRKRIPPKQLLSDKLDEEGLRIPLTPIVSNLQINEPILTAIAGHPQTPHNLDLLIKKEIAILQRKASLLKFWVNRYPSLWSKTNQKQYFDGTRSIAQRMLTELATGETQAEVINSWGEKIKFKTEVRENGIQFDFSGTQSSRRIGIPEGVTHGACYAALSSFLGKKIPLNDGFFSLVGFITPQDSLLNAKYPTPVLPGIIEVGSLLAESVFQSLLKINGRAHPGSNNVVPAMISLKFNSDLIYFDLLPSGTYAQKGRAGADFFFPWILKSSSESIEKMETKFPLRFRAIQSSTESNGAGHFEGGKGILKEIELLENCEFQWIIQLPQAQKVPEKRFHAGNCACIHIQRRDGALEVISAARGTLLLSKGDRLKIQSAGGAGLN